jgi:alpha/beta superfamily hydrolase
MTAEHVRFPSADGLLLEGRLAVPEEPRGIVVLCHPHPVYGGSMSSRLIPALGRAFVAVGWAALRFNFRGVGASEGRFDGGVGEARDVAGALARARDAVPGPVAVVGWSFGALVGMNAAAADGRVTACVAVAPPCRPAFAERLDVPALERPDRLPARSLLVAGTADPFCRPEDLAALAARIPGAEVRLVDGADHFFDAHVHELSAAVVGFVAGG